MWMTSSHGKGVNNMQSIWSMRIIAICIALMSYGLLEQAVLGRADKGMWLVYMVVLAYYIGRTLK